jgi:hypothetical protein
MIIINNMAVARTSFRQAGRMDIVRSLERLGRCFPLSRAKHYLSFFEGLFRSIPLDHQQQIYALAVQMGTTFVPNIYSPTGRAAAKAVAFPFPFADIPLDRYKDVNAIFNVMEKVLQRQEKLRFVVSTNKKLACFGTAREYEFNGVPVVHFSEIRAEVGLSRIGGDAAHKIKGMVVAGDEQIFLFRFEDEYSSQERKTESCSKSTALWEIARAHASMSGKSDAFVVAVNDFIRFKRLAHEWGHVQSFRDERISQLILSPKVVVDGEEYIHPSSNRFRDLGEVYAELVGPIYLLAQQHNLIYFILSFATYARNAASTNSSRDTRTRAFFLLPIFMKNCSVDCAKKTIKVDWEGFLKDIERGKASLYEQYDAYQALTESEKREWVARGIEQLQVCMLVNALGSESEPEVCRKSPVEVVMLRQITAELGIEIRIPVREIWEAIEKERIQLQHHYLDWPSPDRRGVELDMIDRLPRIGEKLLLKRGADTLNNYGLVIIASGKKRASNPAFIIVNELPGYIKDINELMAIKDRILSFVVEKRQEDQKSFITGNELTETRQRIESLVGKYPRDPCVLKIVENIKSYIMELQS